MPVLVGLAVPEWFCAGQRRRRRQQRLLLPQEGLNQCLGEATASHDSFRAHERRRLCRARTSATAPSVWVQPPNPRQSPFKYRERQETRADASRWKPAALSTDGQPSCCFAPRGGKKRENPPPGLTARDPRRWARATRMLQSRAREQRLRGKLFFPRCYLGHGRLVQRALRTNESRRKRNKKDITRNTSKCRCRQAARQLERHTMDNARCEDDLCELPWSDWRDVPEETIQVLQIGQSPESIAWRPSCSVRKKRCRLLASLIAWC